MTYTEIVDTLRHGQNIKSGNISGLWLIYLFQDGIIKGIRYIDKDYKVIFTPYESVSNFFTVNAETCKTFDDGQEVLRTAVRQIVKYKKRFFINLEDEYFEITLEEIKSDE